jgi:hypothetical protein
MLRRQLKFMISFSAEFWMSCSHEVSNSNLLYEQQGSCWDA